MADTLKPRTSQFLLRRRRGALTNRSPAKPLRLHVEQLEERLLLSHAADVGGFAETAEGAPSAADANSAASGDHPSPLTTTFGLFIDFPWRRCMYISTSLTFIGDGDSECSREPVFNPEDPDRERSTPQVIEEEVPAPPPPQAEIHLDPTFGEDGKVITEVEGSLGETIAALQADGKIIVAGMRDDDDALVLARYNNDGTLDTSFGADGVSIVSIVDWGYDFHIQDLALQADGRIVLVGYSWGAEDFVTVRFSELGQLDPSFGDSGIAQTHLGENDYAAHAVAIQPDGKILVGGTVNNDFGLVRLNSDGSLDSNFANGGVATASFKQDSTTENIEDIVIQDDGKILVLGNTGLLRYHSDGTLDASFDDGGVFRSGGDELVLQDDGKFLVLGRTGFRRYNADGSKDLSFGGWSWVTHQISGGGRSFALDTQGNIVVVGTTKNPETGIDFAVARFKPDGSRDGKATLDIGSQNNYADWVVVLPDSSIVVAGHYRAEASGVALARFQGAIVKSCVLSCWV